MTSFDQSEGFISAKCSCTTLKIILDISPWNSEGFDLKMKKSMNSLYRSYFATKIAFLIRKSNPYIFPLEWHSGLHLAFKAGTSQFNYPRVVPSILSVKFMMMSMSSTLITKFGRPPQLREIVSAYHPAAPGSNPKHGIYPFSIYILQITYLSFELECEKNENKQKKTPQIRGLNPVAGTYIEALLPLNNSEKTKIKNTETCT